MAGLDPCHPSLRAFNRQFPRHADLTSVDLSYADLTDAHLIYAKLYRTNLDGADLTRAV